MYDQYTLEVRQKSPNSCDPYPIQQQGFEPLRMRDIVMLRRQRQKGLSLIELTVFIVILGLAASAIVMGVGVAVEKAPAVEKNNQALEYAQQRMDLILGQKAMLGFDSFSDPCLGGTPPAVCTTSGFAFNPAPSITTGWGGDPTNFKVITVTVEGTGAGEFKGNATITALVAKY